MHIPLKYQILDRKGEFCLTLKIINAIFFGRDSTQMKKYLSASHPYKFASIVVNKDKLFVGQLHDPQCRRLKLPKVFGFFKGNIIGHLLN